MAGFERDLEKAFTNGDPEAVLDFLAIRSRQMQHLDTEEDTAGCSIPLFTSDKDMAAFVRDLTIDDAISHCFADVPTGCDDIMTSPTQVSVAARPERKLTESKTAEPARKQPSGAHQTPTADRRPPPSNQAPGSVPRHARGKSRGFLSSLLGRGHKGRREDSPRKPRRRQDPSSKLSGLSCPAGVLGDESRKTPTMTYQPAVDSGPRHVPPCVWDCELLTAVPPPHPEAGTQPSAAVPHHHLGMVQVTDGQEGQVACEPVCVVEYCFPRHAVDVPATVEHKLQTTTHHSTPSALTQPGIHKGHAVDDHIHGTISAVQCGNESVSFSKCAHSQAKRPKGASHQVCPSAHDHSGLSPPAKQAGNPGLPQQEVRAGNHPADRTSPQKAEMLSSQTLPQTQKPPSVEKTAEGETDSTPRAHKPWEGLCDGIDAFIDFERDPNLEVPLDSRLSAQLECTSTVTGPRRDQRQSEVLGTKCPVAERPEAPHVTLAAPAGTLAARGPRASEDRLVTHRPWDMPATTPPCVSASEDRTPCSQTPELAQSRVSTSTQTENARWLLSDGGPSPEIAQCLRTALAQLSSLSACSACEDVVRRALSSLQKALVEMGDSSALFEMDTVLKHKDASSDSFPPEHSQELCAGKQPHNAITEDGGVADNALVEALTPDAESPKTEKPGKTRSQDCKADPEVYHRAQASHRETGLNSKTPLPSKHPEQPTKRSKHSGGGGGGKKHVTSSRTSVDSDSDSTSTVTSEPITVLICQRGSRSSSGSSKVGRPGEKMVSSGRTTSVDGDGGETANPDPPDCAPSSVLRSEAPWASGLGTAKPDNTTLRATTTGATVPASRATPRSRKNARRASHYAGEADRDYESFVTSSWSEMTSVSSVSDIVTSADESSYYSGDDDDNDGEDEEEDDDVTTAVRLGLLDEDRDDSELRQHRLQRHLAAVLRQTSVPTTTVETVVAATGERLNSQERHVNHVNQGNLYPFSPRAPFTAVPGHEATTSVSAPGSMRERTKSATCLLSAAAAGSGGREARTVRKSKKGGGVPRLFSPDRQVSLISARQMTSEEFREGYDRSTDITKLKRSQLDGDIPWDLIPCSDTDDDAGSDKAWYNVTSEEESLAHAGGSDTDSSTPVSDW